LVVFNQPIYLEITPGLAEFINNLLKKKLRRVMERDCLQTRRRSSHPTNSVTHWRNKRNTQHWSNTSSCWRSTAAGCRET